MLLAVSGCYEERSFPMRDSDPLNWPADDLHLAKTQRITVRQWLDEVERGLRPLLPDQGRPTLTSSNMVDADGRPRDVYDYFDRSKHEMQGLISNFWALQHTAQSIEQATYPLTPPPWSGFDLVWIPVAPHVQNAGFLGLARDEQGRIREADCIVVLPGLWGDNGAKRSRDVSEALVRSGFHVLSFEPRGHGRTEDRHPDVPYTYGVLETPDLMAVSAWLQDTYPQIRRTGLMGFCWGANAVLLAAWYDGRTADDPSIVGTLREQLPGPDGRRHFEAGVMAFSPVLRWEEFIDRMDTPKDAYTDLSPSMFQNATRDHMLRRGYPEVTGSLRRCIAYDFAESELGRSFPVLDGYRFMRLMPYRGQSEGDKLERTRVPVLIVHAINDPLQTPQETVDLIAQTGNPGVAALVLPGGGHIGFQAWSRRYFYNLVLRFFDPDIGAAASAAP